MSDHTINSGNISKGLDCVSFDKELTKVKLASSIVRLIEGNGMTHKEAAACLRVSPPQITDLKIGQLDSFTIDRLFSWLKQLDCRVEERLMDEYREQGLCWRLDDEASLKTTAILFPLSIAALTLPYLKPGLPKSLCVIGGLMLITFWFLIYQSYEDRLRIRWKRIHEIEWLLRLDAHLMMHRERATRRMKGEMIRCIMFVVYLFVTAFIVLGIRVESTHGIAEFVRIFLNPKVATLQVLGFKYLDGTAWIIELIEWGVPLIMVTIIIGVGILGFWCRAHLLSQFENKE